MTRKLSPDELEAFFMKALRGMARLQARQEMMECVVRALISETPPAHPLFAKALHTAKQDWEQRSAQARDSNMPETDADAMALWNVLMRSCEPPAEPSK